VELAFQLARTGWKRVHTQNFSSKSMANFSTVSEGSFSLDFVIVNNGRLHTVYMDARIA